MPATANEIAARAQHSGAAAATLRAAQYVRMSTDHQNYSPVNQADANENYAKARGIETVVTYYDPGISGLHIKGRDALQQLIEDVQSKNRLFDVVLVYDISRWGRFQDIDESAYYEYICRRARECPFIIAPSLLKMMAARWPQSPRASSVSPRPNIAASYRLRSSMRSADWSNSVIDKAARPAMDCDACS
jgi:hypothetical protein